LQDRHEGHQQGKSSQGEKDMNAIPKLLTLAGAVLAVGCVEQVGLIDPVPIELAACKPNKNDGPGTPNCQPVKDNEVTANFDGTTVAPPGICVNRGETVRIEVKPKPESYNSVVVLPKDAASFTDWLIGFNDEIMDEVLISIPENAPAGKTFNYQIVELASGRCIDPRIHIN
jgi:hypothetical protein